MDLQYLGCGFTILATGSRKAPSRPQFPQERGFCISLVAPENQHYMGIFQQYSAARKYAHGV